MSKKVKK